MKLIAAWQMNTTCSASAYESTAALRSSGESVGMMVVECLRVHMRAVSFSDIPAAEMRRRRLTECLRLSVVTTRTYGGWSVPLAGTVHGADEGTHRNRVRPVYPLTELRSQDGLQERATQADANDLSGGPEEIRDCARRRDVLSMAEARRGRLEGDVLPVATAMSSRVTLAIIAWRKCVLDGSDGGLGIGST